jgi:hypothetical protein
VVESKVGILTATVFETEPAEVQAGVDHLLATGVFRPLPHNAAAQ